MRPAVEGCTSATECMVLEDAWIDSQVKRMSTAEDRITFLNGPCSSWISS